MRRQKDKNLFVLLEAQAQVALKSAHALHELSKDFSRMSELNEAIKKLEHEGDDLTHELQNRIATTFITPLDKDDLRALSQDLDDVTDFIEAAAARAELYGLKSPRPDLAPAVELLVQATELSERAVRSLQQGFSKSGPLRELLKEIHTVENASDRAFRQALKSLFDEPGIDALTVIKWKELYDRIETAVDKCEDIAATIGTIIDKYA